MKKIKKIPFRFNAAAIAKIAVLTALSFVLYAFGKFNLPFMFPSFLEMQFSELPALLAGFSMGPVAGCFVIVTKCLLKLPMSSTGFVGELTDIIIGICFVLPASLIYKKNKSKKSALIGVIAGALVATVAAVLVNRFISIPFYVEFFFGGNWEILLSMVRPLYHEVTRTSFYTYYLLLAVVPFNLLRAALVALLTFLLYKRLSPILHWEIKRKSAVAENENGSCTGDCEGCPSKGGCAQTTTTTTTTTTTIYTSSDEETQKAGENLAATLRDGDVVLLNGELGAGKTTFTKGIARGLGFDGEVTSPTFTFMNTYEGGWLPVCHIDCYRAETADEIFELGLADRLGKGICVIEWNKLPTNGLSVIIVDIEYDGDGRKITVEG